jgi:hypothetical protein
MGRRPFGRLFSANTGLHTVESTDCKIHHHHHWPPHCEERTSKEKRRADKSQEREHSTTQGRLFSACIEIFQTTKMQTRSRTLSQYFTGILTLSPLTIDQADISVTIDTNGHEQTFF